MNSRIRNTAIAALLALALGACSDDSGGGGGNANDTTAPVVSGVSAAGLATDSPATGGATVTWTTDDAADSQVEYGPDTTYGSSTTLSATRVTNHSVEIDGLTPGDVYHYRVKSTNAAGLETVSADFTLTAPEQWLLLAEDGSLSSNNLSVFKASASSPIQSIDQVAQTWAAPQTSDPTDTVTNTHPLGEIHVANGKAFVVLTNGLYDATNNPTCVPSCGGLVVFDLDTPDTPETVVTLESTATTRPSRIVHAYVESEGAFLWAHNDGPSGDAGADSVFRVDVDPASPTYLQYDETVVGNGHKKAAIGGPSTTQPTAATAYYVSSLTERRIDVLDRTTPSGTAPPVIKIIRNLPASPHGMDYAPNAGRAFSGVTGGGLVSIDGTMLDAANFPDVDCAGITNNYCVSSVGQPNAGTPDPSVYILSTGAGSNTTLASGYIHVVTHEEDNEDTVYATGRSNAASMGWLTAINPGAGATPPGQGVDGVVAIELGDMSASNFAVSHSGHKAYVPSSGGGTINDLIRVIDVDHASATHNQIITSVTVGTAVGENRNIQASPDGRVVFVPNTSTNSVSVIDTETDTVVDTMNLATGTTAGNVRAFKLPFDGEDNH